VKNLQDLFTKVSQDGVMGPPEWRKCLTAAGIHNTFVVERLFELFDSSSDQRMTAKEFTTGLSELVSDADPRGEAAELEARRQFAFRFYDQTREEYFERADCVSFLKSWVVCARDAVRLSNERFLDVYGVDQIDLVTIQSPVQGAARSAVTGLYQRVYEQLDEYCVDVWREFAAHKGGERMTQNEFVTLTVVAPQVFDWLTELGTTLGRELEKLRGMNFEGPAATVAEGTELSVTRMKQTFAASAHHGAVDQPAFKRCIRGLLGEDSPGFAAALFRAIDVNKNGSLSQDEFVDAFTTIVRGSTADKANIAFRIHDVRGVGYLEPKTLRSCFSTWLEPSLNKVDVLTSSLEQWMSGRVDASGARKGALQCFDAAGRMRNMEIPSRIRKASAREVAMMSDALVEHAMLHARKSRQQLFPDEFAGWIASTDFLYWMEGLGRSWMVTPQQLEAETPPSEKRRARTAALLASAASERERLAKLCPKGESYYGLQPRGSSASPAGREWTASRRADVWWARCFGLRHATRRSIRPRTSFDQVTLERLWQTIERHVVDRTAFDRDSFSALMRELRIENPLIILRLFAMFDVNNDGNLSAEEVATGLALLARGGASERLRIVFNTFDVGRDGALSRDELEVLLRAFCCIAMGVIDGLVDYLSSVCGLVQSTEASANELKEFQQKLLTGARSLLRQRTAAMLKETFAAESSSSSLTWEYFGAFTALASTTPRAACTHLLIAAVELWADSTPTFARWVERLGLACLESLVPLEIRLSQQSSAHVGSAACRLQRKWPDGHPLRSNSVAGVRAAVLRFSRSGRLDAAQFRACMAELHLRSPLGHRRMFNLLDRDVAGSVSSLEAATCLLLLCGASAKDKLQAMWTLWDYDDRGFLSEMEVGMVFECLYLVGMDTVSATFVAISEVMAEADVSFAHSIMLLAHGRLRAYISELIAQIVAFAGQSVYLERLWEWAEQREEFLTWLAALGDSWTDSCLAYEAESVKHVADAATGALARPGTQLPLDAPSTTELEPLPHCGLSLMGPGLVYPFRYSVKKSFRIHLGSSERRMRCAPPPPTPAHCLPVSWPQPRARLLTM
jgi:Ca2+-binding EF-hand superfamily protein